MRPMRTRVRWILYLVVFAVGVIVGLFGHVIPALVRRTSQPPIEVRGQTAVRPRSTNVWGTLEALRIPLENSADFFPDRVVRLQPARWFFEGFNESALSNFLNQCELTRAQAGDLLDTNHWQ